MNIFYLSLLFSRNILCSSTPQYLQEYIEDCEVCCNPIEVKVSAENQEITKFEVFSIEQ